MAKKKMLSEAVEKLSAIEIDVLFELLFTNKHFVEKIIGSRIVAGSLCTLFCGFLLLILSKKFKIEFSLKSKKIK